MDNKIFFLLPITGTDIVDLEQTYLKVEPQWTEATVKQLADAVSSAVTLNNHENCDKVFDQNRFNDIRSVAKTFNQKNRKWPSLVSKLDAAFKNLVHFQSIKALNSKTIISCNNVQLQDTILNAYINESDRDSVTIADANALCIPLADIIVTNANGEKISTNVLSCTDKDVYLWFIDHRKPRRVLDPNYRKHSKNSRLGKKQVRISPLTYSKEKTTEFLHKAVSSPDDKKNLFYLDTNRNAILVFWDEDLLAAPSFHAYEISADDKKEIQKIYKKGSTALMDKITKTSTL